MGGLSTCTSWPFLPAPDRAEARGLGPLAGGSWNPAGITRAARVESAAGLLGFLGVEVGVADGLDVLAGADRGLLRWGAVTRLDLGRVEHFLSGVAHDYPIS